MLSYSSYKSSMAIKKCQSRDDTAYNRITHSIAKMRYYTENRTSKNSIAIDFSISKRFAQLLFTFEIGFYLIRKAERIFCVQEISTLYDFQNFIIAFNLCALFDKDLLWRIIQLWLATNLICFICLILEDEYGSHGKAQANL